MHAVITDRKLQVEDTNNLGTVNYFTANVSSYTDYYPFGMVMPGRSYTSSDAYRYLFNGKEIQDEIELGLYHMDFRQLDPQIGRWVTLDPLLSLFPWQSPYAGFDNNPVFFNDPQGLAANGPEGEKDPEKGDYGISESGEQRVYDGMFWNTTPYGGFVLNEVSLTPPPEKNQGIILLSLASSASSNVDNPGFKVMEGFYDFSLETTPTKKEIFYELAKTKDGTASILNNPSLPDSYKKEALIHFMHNGPAAAFYKEFSLNVVLTAGSFGLGGILSNGIRGSFARVQQRMINAAKSSTKLLPMLSQTTTKNVLSSAQVLNKNGLSVAGRALQKHAGRPGPFSSIKFSHKTGNQQGLDVLNSILNSKNPIIQNAGNGGYRIFDGATGRGFGLSRNGLFNGFRQLP